MTIKQLGQGHGAMIILYFSQYQKDTSHLMFALASGCKTTATEATATEAAE